MAGQRQVYKAGHRWQAPGAHYAPDYETAAAASSARYQALADWYAKKATSGE